MYLNLLNKTIFLLTDIKKNLTLGDFFLMDCVLYLANKEFEIFVFNFTTFPLFIKF